VGPKAGLEGLKKRTILPLSGIKPAFLDAPALGAVTDRAFAAK
jgi:hypothetical protein